MAGGRPCKYHTHVEPRLDEVEKYATYMTEAQIAKVMGVSASAFIEYKKQFPALTEALKKGRLSLVSELRSALIMRAKGYDYTETTEKFEGGALTERQIKHKHMAPDVAALNLALKNYDPDNWANDPQMLKIRKDELRLRQQAAEDNRW